MKGAKLKRSDTIFICGKCLKRHPEAKAMRRALKTQARIADAKIVRTSCLGVCPKKAVVVANRASLADGRVVLLMLDANAADAISALPDRRSAAARKATG